MRFGSRTHAEVNEIVAREGVVAAGGKLGVAAILYTYQCTIACRHCCFGCAAGNSNARMSTPQALKHLRSLHRLGRVIHIAGGECMMYWDELKALLAAARSEGVQPHFVETNCSFAVDERTVRERLDCLRSCGVRGILLSADPYHQEFVSPENFLWARSVSREVFGPENVWCTDASDKSVLDLARIARDPGRLREYVRAGPPMLVGRAQRELCRYLDGFRVDQVPLDTGWHVRYRQRDCAVDFAPETIWEVHIDPYDNIQTNCGVILGNALRVRVETVMRQPAGANFVAETLAREGPFGLAKFAAERHGFVPPERVCSKCDLCYTVRKFLRREYPEILGPAEVYDP